MSDINNINLFNNGYSITPNFITQSVIDDLLNKIDYFKRNCDLIKNKISDFDVPVVTFFVAGFKNDQLIIKLNDFNIIKNIIELMKLDIVNKFNPEKLFAYEITIFEKKKGSPKLVLHQDSWYHPFLLSENKFEFFSYYIPLTNYIDKDSSRIGIINLNNINYKENFVKKHIITGDDLSKINSKLLLVEKDIYYPDLFAGDCLIFEIRSPHLSLEHTTIESRFALSVRFGIVPPKINDLNESHANFVEQLKKFGDKIFYNLI